MSCYQLQSRFTGFINHVPHGRAAFPKVTTSASRTSRQPTKGRWETGKINFDIIFEIAVSHQKCKSAPFRVQSMHETISNGMKYCIRNWYYSNPALVMVTTFKIRRNKCLSRWTQSNRTQYAKSALIYPKSIVTRGVNLTVYLASLEKENEDYEGQTCDASTPLSIPKSPLTSGFCTGI